MRLASLSSALGALVIAVPLAAQQSGAAPGDSLRLSALQTEALAADPRRRQLELQSRVTAASLRSLEAERLPSISGTGLAQYQSAVTHIAIPFPGITIPTPPNNTIDARVNAQESILDPTLRPREALEQARLEESRAQIRTTLYTLRQDVNEAFFSALLGQERAAQVEATIADLAARLRETETRRREGAATPGDTAAIAATLLQRRQDLAQIRADRRAALNRLSDLVGRPIPDSTPLAPPAADANAARALEAPLDSLRARPEYAQFTAARERLARQEAVVAAQDKPRLSAFGRLGYGRPGLNMLSSEFQSYWIAGVQVQWAPWNWGTTARDREALELQRDIVASNEAAFTASLRRGLQQSLATMQRLDTTLALDDRIVALREQVEREAAAKLREGVITAAEYADRASELLAARLARAQHRVEAAQARATYLTTTGVDAP
jgi:outer membrane protein TolC